MKKILILLLSLMINLCFSQTKEQLIDSIIKVNRVESDCVGYGCMVGAQFKRFEKLKSKLSNKELIELSKHENATIRTYASIELIQSKKGNVPELLLAELERNEMVETFEGCSMGSDPVSSLIYHEYWNKIRIEASREMNDISNKQEVAMKKRLATDSTMEKLDSIIIYANKEVYWLLYSRAFQNRKHKDSYLPRIEELAFKNNNSFALEYLRKHYPIKSAKKIENYLTTVFPKAKFQTDSDIFYLHSIIESLLESKNDDFKQIAIQKLRTNEVWKERKAGFYATLKEYGIEL